MWFNNAPSIFNYLINSSYYLYNASALYDFFQFGSIFYLYENDILPVKNVNNSNIYYPF